MKHLAIGDVVEVKALAEMVYVNNKRVVERTPIEPQQMVIVGKRRKMLGRYQKGYGYGPSGYFGLEPDYDPPYLAVSGSLQLWEVRSKIDSAPKLVHDEDLEVVYLSELVGTGSDDACPTSRH